MSRDKATWPLSRASRHVSPFSMKRMAKELNVPLAYFFCESDDEAELLKLFSQMGSLQKAELLIYLKKKNSTG